MTIRVAAIEVSHWHALYDAAYLRHLIAMPDVELVAIQDSDAGLVARRAAELGIGRRIPPQNPRAPRSGSMSAERQNPRAPRSGSMSAERLTMSLPALAAAPFESDICMREPSQIRASPKPGRAALIAGAEPGKPAEPPPPTFTAINKAETTAQKACKH
jgi:hypothetical protein